MNPKRTIGVLYGQTSYRQKSKRILQNFFKLVTPFKCVKDENEYGRIYTRKKRASIEDVYADLTRNDIEMFKEDIENSDSNWKGLTKIQ